jgi:hypothetical protein
MMQLRRVVGKFGFFLAGCWMILVFSGVVAVVKGTSIPLMNWAAALVPGSMFVPGVYYGVRLHTTQDPEQMRAFWHRCAVYSMAGLVLMIGTGYLLYSMGKADMG